MSEAREVGNDNTLTPVILRKVYDRMKADNALEVELGSPELLRWQNLMDIVSEGVLIPALRDDIYSSFHDDARVVEIYDELILEIVALFQDANAVQFENKSSQMVNINRKRFEEIGGIFHKNRSTTSCRAYGFILS